jgi:hypothetical protein
MSGLPAEAISAGLCRSVFGKVREEGYQGRSPWLVRLGYLREHDSVPWRMYPTLVPGSQMSPSGRPALPAAQLFPEGAPRGWQSRLKAPVE